MSLDSGGAALLQVNVQAVIVEYLIKNVHVFFDEKAAAAAIVANPRYSSGSWERQQKIVADLGKDICRVKLLDLSCEWHVRYTWQLVLTFSNDILYYTLI